jgi:rhamnogalacturonan endolyase
MENLDRGVVAVKVTGGVYVGWRMMGYEYTGTDSDTSYNLYKDGTLLKNVTDSTNYLDAAGTATSKYTVSAVLKGTEGKQSAPVTVWAQQYTSIPLTHPPMALMVARTARTMRAQGISMATANSTSCSSGIRRTRKTIPVGRHRRRLHRRVHVGRQACGASTWARTSAPGALHADVGVRLRRRRQGGVAVKTAPGTKDGTGAYLSTGPRCQRRRQRCVPQCNRLHSHWARVPDRVRRRHRQGTGDRGLSRASRHVSSWGDAYGNRLDRYNGGIAFVKGKGVANGLPSIIQQRGYYTRLTVSAYDLARWRVGDRTGSSTATTLETAKPLAVATTHAWRRMWTATARRRSSPAQRPSNSDGTFKCSSGMGHGDAMHVGSWSSWQGHLGVLGSRDVRRHGLP